MDVPVRLNTNESPHRLPDAYFDTLASIVKALPLNRYPDDQMIALREKLAERTGHPVEGIWTANGSNEVLTQLLLAYGGPGHKIVLFEPTYGLHQRLAWLTNTDVVTFKLAAPFVLGARDVAAANSLRAHVVFACSPNNPTGNAQPLEAVKRLTEGSSALVIVDEAYIDFGGETALAMVGERPNLVVVRTLSKAFALAGARVGYCLAPPKVIEDLQRVRIPYNMSALAQAAGLAALEHTEDALTIVAAIRLQRDRIVESLRAMTGTKVHPSDANFVLFEPPKPAAQVWQGLVDRGILIRDLSSVVPNALRVSVGSVGEVDRFLEALKEVLAE